MHNFGQNIGTTGTKTFKINYCMRIRLSSMSEGMLLHLNIKWSLVRKQ